jgi:NAD(P)-dependent dehydrogenase (short-subunit alcohol dehydrogenase family)
VSRLAGETALVTGATAGLGREVARVMAREGARVVISGRNAERGAAVVADIRAEGGHVDFVAADISREEVCVALVARAVELNGSLTVLVNNATSPEAIARDSVLGEMKADVWQTLFEVNLLAPALVCREAIAHMRAAGHGAIVNVSSRAAERGVPGLAGYSATKAGMNALARSITVEYGREGIRCNTLQLGYVLNAERDAGRSPESWQRLEAMSATRLTTPEDVANAVVFLASRESKTLTGVNLRLDGGSSVLRGGMTPG